MESRILFLGTGTSAVANQQVRSSGGIVINTNGYQFVLDPGPGALVKARQFGVNLRATTAVLVSHAHLNHCNDANAVISAMSHDGLDVQGVLIANHSYVRGTEEIRPWLSSFHQKCVERIIVPEPSQKIGIEHAEIHALKTMHSDPHALGFKFFTPAFVLCYTGDTGYNKDVVEQYLHSDILVLNMPHSDVKDEFNLNREDVLKILKKVQPRLAVITHFGPKALKDDVIAIARNLHQATDVQTIAAKDGMVITPTSYAAGLTHKTLNLFAQQEHIQEGIQG